MDSDDCAPLRERSVPWYMWSTLRPRSSSKRVFMFSIGSMGHVKDGMRALRRNTLLQILYGAVSSLMHAYIGRQDSPIPKRGMLTP